jgi:hypothetical protein
VWRNKVMQRRFRKMKCVNEFNLVMDFNKYVLTESEIKAQAKLYKDFEAGKIKVPDCVYDYILNKTAAIAMFTALKFDNHNPK